MVRQKWKEAETDIMENMKKHESTVDIDYDELLDDQNNEYQHEETSGNNSVNASSASTATVTNDKYYHMCTQLNERKQHLFNYFM